MIFETKTPKGILGKYVETLIYFKHFNPDHSMERVVPTGHSFLIFELDNLLRNVYDNLSLKPIAEYREAWYSGAFEDYLSISAHPNSEMLAIQFKPYGAFPFINKDISDYTNQVVDAQQVFNGNTTTIRNQIMLADSPANKFNTIEDWLLKQFNAMNEPPEVLINCIHIMDTENEVFEKVKTDYPTSQKHMIQQFKKFVGLTPKTYLRIVRFNQIFQRLMKEEKISWAEIAYSCGYSDQSHFIKEFKRFSGFNPTEFIELEHYKSEPNFFPLD